MPLAIMLKQMLPGLLPLFIFIAADEIWGTKTGLYVAVVFGVIELIITRIKEKHWEGFIILDTVFLVLLGGISILLENAIFFRLKPALIEFILCIILAAAAVHPEKFFGLVTSRYLKNTELTLNVKGIRSMRRMMFVMTLAFTAHTLLTVYAAFRMSQAAWAFISGGLFYIVFVVIIAGQFTLHFIRRRRSGVNRCHASGND